MAIPGGPLAGVRVLDAAGMIAAPSACAMMADLGADVIKLEPPQGDLLRGLVAVPGGPDPWWELDNRGKRGIVVDLTTEQGIQVAHKIAASCDVFVTNLTTERQSKFKLTASDLRDDHPQLIHLTLTGYGNSGPDRDRLAFDYTAFFSRGGVVNTMGEPGHTPPAGRPGQGDHTTSLAILSSILLALRERDLTGEGQDISVALMHTAIWTMSSDLSVGLATGEVPGPIMRIETPSPLVGRFRCADDRWIMLTMPADRYWDAFCGAMGQLDWLDDPRFADPETRAQHGPELMILCDEIFASASSSVWADRLDAAGMVWGLIQNLEEVITDPQSEALKAFEQVPGAKRPFRTVSPPFALDGSEMSVKGPAPEHGQHTTEILLEAGFSPDEVSRLYEQEVVV
ncbi:MAG: CoA transferase [Actinomycetota bacterium]|nr:CoA transferase [Actinomycetota bacterium]